jgi:hypothetical protein
MIMNPELLRHLLPDYDSEKESSYEGIFMNYSSFSEGLSVRYRDYVGTIKFICNSYITICINNNEIKLRQVCILVYSNQWEEIKLLKQSEK